MADLTYDQLTAIGTPDPVDLVAIYDMSGELLKKQEYGDFVSDVGGALGSTFLSVSANLGDLASASVSRANLGLGTVATLAAGAVFQVANNLSEVANAATARTNIGAASSTSPVITGGMTFTGATVGNTNAIASTTIDASVAEFQSKTISTNTTFTLTGVTSGKWSAVLLKLTSSAGAQPTFTGAEWSGGAAPTIPDGVSMIGLIYDGTVWTAIIIGALIA